MQGETAMFLEGWEGSVQAMQRQAPKIAKGFGSLFQSVMGEGALTVREKELIALGIGLSVRCVPCINLHVRKCLSAGATPEQVLEAAGVAVMMQGGPSFTHLPEVIKALEYLKDGSGANQAPPAW